MTPVIQRFSALFVRQFQVEFDRPVLHKQASDAMSLTLAITHIMSLNLPLTLAITPIMSLNLTHALTTNDAS